MAKNLAQDAEGNSKLTEHRMRQAFRAIEADENLRYLFRSILTQCGWNQTPVASTTEGTYKLCGRHEIGIEIINSMLAYTPNLYPNLIKEDLDENNAYAESDGEPDADDESSR